MKRAAFILLTLVTLSFSQKVGGCSCNHQGAFLTVAPKTSLVALVKVIRYLSFKDIYGYATAMSMEVEVVEVYKGQEERRTFIVWGDTGNLCRPYLSEFAEDTCYVIAFDRAGDGRHGYTHKGERPTDYTISCCGDYWLAVDYAQQIAVGAITDSDTQIALAELKAKLQTNTE